MVTTEEAINRANSLGALYAETSAKHSIAVEDTFKRLCEDILARVAKGDITLSEKTDSIKVGSKCRSGSLCWSQDNSNEKRNSCCF